MNKKKDWLKKQIERLGLKPSFDETSIALMFLSFIFLYILDAEMRSEITSFIHGQAITFLFRISEFLVLGAVYTFVGILKGRIRSINEERMMVFAALVMNIFASLCAYVSAAKHGFEWYYLLFPIFNFLVFLLTFILIWFHFYWTRELFSPSKGSWHERFVGVGFILIFSVCAVFILNIHWSAVFSMSVAYASVLNKLPFFKKAMRKIS